MHLRARTLAAAHAGFLRGGKSSIGAPPVLRMRDASFLRRGLGAVVERGVPALARPGRGKGGQKEQRSGNDALPSGSSRRAFQDLGCDLAVPPFPPPRGPSARVGRARARSPSRPEGGRRKIGRRCARGGRRRSAGFNNNSNDDDDSNNDNDSSNSNTSCCGQWGGLAANAQVPGSDDCITMTLHYYYYQYHYYYYHYSYVLFI